MTSHDPAAAAKDIADYAKDAAGRARTDLNDAAATATSHASDLVGKLGDTAADAFQRVRDGASALGDRIPSAGEAVDAGRRAYDQGSRNVAKQVSRQPIEALLLAGAIGYLVGWAANRS